MITKQQVIERYREVVGVEKMTAARFARDLGTTKQVVHNWGDRIPSHWALRVSRLTGIPVEDLLEDESQRAAAS